MVWRELTSGSGGHCCNQGDVRSMGCMTSSVFFDGDFCRFKILLLPL